MIKKKSKIIFISWTTQGRHTELFANALKAEMFFISKHFKKTSGILLVFDYLLKTIKSFNLIIKKRPEYVFVQNPPSFSPVVIVILSKIFRFKTVIDSHNGAFEKPWIKVPLHKWALKNADLVTVHNEVLLQNLYSTGEYSGIEFHKINSKLSEFSNQNFRKVDNYFLVISSFASDEPMYILLEGISIFLKKNKEFKFKVTGSYERQIDVYNSFKNNEGIEFLGFIDEPKYLKLLRNAFGAISVSKRDDVQQFSLMECVGLEVPFISNSNKTNKILFNDRMPLFELEPQAVSDCIINFIKRKEEFNENIKKLKKELQIKWDNDFNKLINKLNIYKNE